MKYLLSLLCFIWFLNGTALAQDRYASFVMNAYSEEVMQEENADEERIPASLTKMMTLYLLFEDLQENHITLETRITASRAASRQPPTRIGIRRGNSITVDQAIRALVVTSANDVALMVAERLGGSEARFVQRMNRKARELGMEHTTFGNASGLPNPRNHTTARDMGLLSLALWRDYPEYYHYFSTPSFTYGRSSNRNHNHLIGAVEGVDGIKTGYTRASGFNLATMVERNGVRLIIIVLGGASSQERNDQVITLIDGAYDEIDRRQVYYTAAH